MCGCCESRDPNENRKYLKDQYIHPDDNDYVFEKAQEGVRFHEE